MENNERKARWTLAQVVTSDPQIVQLHDEVIAMGHKPKAIYIAGLKYFKNISENV